LCKEELPGALLLTRKELDTGKLNEKYQLMENKSMNWSASILLIRQYAKRSSQELSCSPEKQLQELPSLCKEALPGALLLTRKIAPGAVFLVQRGAPRSSPAHQKKTPGAALLLQRGAPRSSPAHQKKNPGAPLLVQRGAPRSSPAHFKNSSRSFLPCARRSSPAHQKKNSRSSPSCAKRSSHELACAPEKELQEFCSLCKVLESCKEPESPEMCARGFEPEQEELDEARSF
jgi:hypothetical protein